MRLLVTGVDEASVDAAMRILPFRRSARVWSESDVNSAILTSSPSQLHDVAASQLFFKIACGFANLRDHGFLSFGGVGMCRFGSSNSRSKQASAGIMCNTRTKEDTAWPNLVIELGHSESMTLLQLDAKWWLTASGGLTRIAIVVQVELPENTIHLETWRLQPNPQAQPTGQAPSHLPINTQTIDIDAAGVVTPANASLTIRYADIFDVGHTNGQDVVLSTTQLTQFAQFVFIHCIH